MDVMSVSTCSQREGFYLCPTLLMICSQHSSRQAMPHAWRPPTGLSRAVYCSKLVPYDIECQRTFDFLAPISAVRQLRHLCRFRKRLSPRGNAAKGFGRAHFATRLLLNNFRPSGAFPFDNVQHGTDPRTRFLFRRVGYFAFPNS